MTADPAALAAEIARHQPCVCADTPKHCRVCPFELGWPCLVRRLADELIAGRADYYDAGFRAGQRKALRARRALATPDGEDAE